MKGSFPEIPFSKSTLADWQNAATLELNGSDPFVKLAFHPNALELKPYYHKIDRQQATFFLHESTQAHYGPRQWLNVPKIQVTNETESNELAVFELQSGADGILFEIHTEKVNFESLLKGIKPEICQLSFLSNTQFDSVGFLKWAENNNALKNLSGCLFQKTSPNLTSDFSRGGFFSYGIIIKPQPDVTDEIAHALVEATELIERTKPEVTNQIAFSISVTNQLFIDVAKLKALRLLWHQIQGAYCMPLNPLHIHAMTQPWQPTYQPHGTMIKSTTAALAAVLGGCDSLTIVEEDSQNAMMKRVARNVSSILREEGHLHKVADSTAGSFYMDSLVNQIAEKAWSKFQELTK